MTDAFQCAIVFSPFAALDTDEPVIWTFYSQNIVVGEFEDGQYARIELSSVGEIPSCCSVSEEDEGGENILNVLNIRSLWVELLFHVMLGQLLKSTGIEAESFKQSVERGDPFSYFFSVPLTERGSGDLRPIPSNR